MGQVVVPPEMDELANEIGEFICYWGFKKVHGRIWTHLYLSKQALDAGELIQRLKVSKALISLSVNDLLRHDVILESEKSPRGTQTYIANPNILTVITNVLKKRESKLLSTVEEKHRRLADVPPETLQNNHVCPDRLIALGQLVGQANGTLQALLEFTQFDFGELAKFNG